VPDPVPGKMSKFILERRQSIPGDISTVFRFFENPYNLSLITPGWLNFKVRSTTNQQVREGTRITYSMRWLGVPVRWQSLIARYRKNEMFADEMLRGPYRSWYHTHEFEEVPGGVAMMDRVEYELPLGWLGRVAHTVMVRRQLDAIFDFRATHIERILGR